MLQLIVGNLALLFPLAAGLIAAPASTSGKPQNEMLVLFAVYIAGFFIFSVGFTAFLRSRTSTTLAARLLLLAVHFLVAIGPWVVAAIAGVMASGGDRTALVVAAPSPFYAFLALDALDRGRESILIVGSIFMSVVWALFGLLFLGLAKTRTSRVIAQHHAALAESDRLLAAEDVALAEAAAARAAAAEAPAQNEQAPAETPSGDEPAEPAPAS